MRVLSTSHIEAGVDVDFNRIPEMAGLDSILQAAGAVTEKEGTEAAL